jgi:hypothetical protein
MKPSLSTGGAPILASNFIKLSMPLALYEFKEADRVGKRSPDLGRVIIHGMDVRAENTENVVAREGRVQKTPQNRM